MFEYDMPNRLLPVLVGFLTADELAQVEKSRSNLFSDAVQTHYQVIRVREQPLKSIGVENPYVRWAHLEAPLAYALAVVGFSKKREEVP
jgi:hypothetical protein